jgi:UrcA family protein
MERIMRNTNRKHLKFPLVLAFTGLFFAANLAVAQQVTEEIVVKSAVERTEARIPIGSSVTTQTVELNRSVGFDDLDLSKHEDVEKLDTRISEVAEESCQELSDMFPFDRSDRMEMNRCVEKAIASARRQKEMALALAP